MIDPPVTARPLEEDITENALAALGGIVLFVREPKDTESKLSSRVKIEPEIMDSGTQTIELARIDTSCPCLTVGVPPHVAPGAQVEGRAKLDLRDEPVFTGEVAIEIRGWTSAGETAFLVVAAVRVPRKGGK